ncbi:MAG: sugar ABC transporter substrate-binding protein [Burkholderiaceae bacterium]|jgi:ribose transport system substrate-binding protein|nr:sugar ABC transporter substrate-binding protein [Burkholderiaceae bacterium]MCU0963517.1 sugar ABC transporter substrate-binding protein [Burkholderiaceae bacterium]
MKIAVFTKNRSNAAYAAARLGADRAAQMFGAELRHYVPEIPDDAAQQSALIHEALAEGCDAFVLSPVHPTKVDDAIAAIRRSGRPIFGFVSRMPAGQCVSFVGAADGRLAEDVAEVLFAHLGGRGDVAIVGGPADSVTGREREAAFEVAARRHPGIRIAARCRGAYLQEPAREAFATLLRECAQVDAVLAANDAMALGVLDALEAAGRRAVVVGVNAIPQAVKAVGSGRLLATADFNAMQMCFLATECAIRHGRGETVPAEIELPVAIVHAGNWRDWDQPYAQRPLSTLATLATPRAPTLTEPTP